MDSESNKSEMNLKWYAKIIKHRTNAAKSEGLPCYLMKLIQARQRSIQFLHDPTIRRKKKKSPIHTDTYSVFRDLNL